MKTLPLPKKHSCWTTIALGIGLDHLHTLYWCPTPEDTLISTTLLPAQSSCTPCLIPKHLQVLSCSTPICLACNVAKARQCPCNTGHTTHPDLGEQHVLSQNVLWPGQQIFVDQYESSVCGCLGTSQGLKSPLTQYCGGTLFFDVALQFIYL